MQRHMWCDNLLSLSLSLLVDVSGAYKSFKQLTQLPLGEKPQLGPRLGELIKTSTAPTSLQLVTSERERSSN